MSPSSTSTSITTSNPPRFPTRRRPSGAGSNPSRHGKAKKLALTVLMRKLIILANLLLKNPNFTLAS